MNRSLLFILVKCLFGLIGLASFLFFLPHSEFLSVSCVYSPSYISSSFNPHFTLANSIKSCGIVFAFMSLLCHARRWDSSVGIVTRLKAGPHGVTILWEKRDFLISKISRLDVELPHPPLQCMFGVLFLQWAKCPVCEFDFTLTSNVKDERSCTSIPAYVFLAYTGITLTFYQL